MRSRLTRTLAAAAVAASAFICSAGTALASFTFIDGVGTGNITIGDKLFSHFTCDGSSNIVAVGLNPCDFVTYQALTGGEFGVDFNPAILSLSGSTFTFADTKIEFEVTTTDGRPLIADFFLSSNATATGTGSIRDTLEICTTQGCGTHIFGPQDATTPNLNIPDFNLAGGPFSDIWVIDDILSQIAVGTPGPGTTSISRLDKVVTQVPEPASLLLIGAGLLGMGFVRRRGTK